MPVEPTLPRYMTRFRCIAERCEDTCCSGLKVPVSEPRRERMRAAVEGHPEDAARLAQHVTGGFIQMRQEGQCPFLDTEKLCSLQRRHGDEALPDICATFPRVITRWGERAEVSGTLACPEVARLCLLDADALERVPVPSAEAHIPREESVRSLPEADARMKWAETVRTALLRLLHRREYPLASRLVMLGHLAHAVDAGEAPLPEVLAHYEAPEVLEALHRDFSALSLPGGPVVGLLTSVLKSRLATSRSERFTTLLRGVLDSLHLDGERPGALELAWNTYAERWQRLEALHATRVHQYFNHYAEHQVWRSAIIDAPSLLAYVFRIVLRVALLRLTFAGHPRVPEQLDAAAVETFQLLAKHVEASPDFLALAEGLAGEGGEQTLGKVIILAAF